MSFGTPETPQLPVPPQATAPPPLFGMNAKAPGQKPQRKSSQPTVLGAEMAPQNQGMGKTLLGQ